jgi:hypothetical protein
MKRIEKEFNALTGEETITERDETAQEVAEREGFDPKSHTVIDLDFPKILLYSIIITWI